MCAVIDRDPDAKFWSEIAKVPWIDATRIFIVNAPASNGATSIRGSRDIATGHYRIDGHDVLAPVDVVESFAAGYIAQQLKGSAPTNGRTR